MVIAIIYIESGGPVSYRQGRFGYKGSIFELLKFRSIINRERNLTVQIKGDEAEVTIIGRIIRRLKIDDLPQLINVIKGEMSIVGPRPCLRELQESYNKDWEARLNVRPGITGLVLINGNIQLSGEERWALDRAYVENQSLSLDLQIIAKTVIIVGFGDKWGLKHSKSA